MGEAAIKFDINHMDITDREHCFLPLSTLEKSPVTLQFGAVPITVVLANHHACLISVPSHFIFTDSDAPGRHISTQVGLGTSFVVSYKGQECEVRLGRRITVLDPDTVYRV
jgi:hypothetical protein